MIFSICYINLGLAGDDVENVKYLLKWSLGFLIIIKIKYSERNNIMDFERLAEIIPKLSNTWTV